MYQLQLVQQRRMMQHAKTQIEAAKHNNNKSVDVKRVGETEQHGVAKLEK